MPQQTTRGGRAQRSIFWASALLLLLTMVLGPGAAIAHEGGDPTVQVVLDALPELLSGVQVQVAEQLTSQLVLANPTDRTLEVVSLDGRAFLRIGPEGVQANVAVADWYTTNDPFGGTPLPEDIGGADDWRTVSLEPAWGWYDHRLHPGRVTAPPAVAQLGEPAEFGSWAVPVTVDGEPVELTGRYRFQPMRGGYTAEVTDEVQFADVRLVVLPGPQNGLFIDNAGEEVIQVLGQEGEPFLMVGPDGVQANLRSPAWLASARSGEGTSPTEPIDPTAAPVWADVADEPRFGWIDPRINPVSREPDAAVIARAQPAEVLAWEVGLSVAGQVQEVAGVTMWQPSPGLAPVGQGLSDGAIRLLALGTVGLLAVAGLVLTRRRGRRSAR